MDTVNVTEERRLVTVLFADVTGSTGLGETLDPEALRHLLARYFAIAGEVVGGHGGTIEKFIGDAVMAVFGLPTAHGDDADRALDAALELRDRVRADEVLGERLPIRLGVNTGEVVASRGTDAGDFLVTGDPVNVAARLQQTAEPWAIVVGERTVGASRGAFTFRSLGPVEARGKSQPILASELVGRGGTRRVPRTPLVGRSGDLAQLALAADRAFGERRPFLVSVIAAPGVGKTRLLEEAVDRLRRTRPDLRVAVAQCLPYGQRLTYLPMRALLLDLLDLPDDLPSESLRRAIRSWLEEAGDPSADRTAELLAATIGAAESELGDPGALFAAWRSTVELAARRQPLLLVIEDLHWSSDSLLDLVESILQPRTDVPLLMVALARPELLDRRSTWGGGRRNYISLTLEPLEDDEVADLVSHLLEGAGSDIVASIVERADGNPFYAGEIVRSIVEGAPDLRDGTAVAARLAALPDTVQATVLARLDLLPTAARRLLQLGAVLGRTFRLATVAGLAPDMAADGERHLDELIDRDLVRPIGSQTVEFRHILIREVAYGTLTRTERVDLHEAAGAWLEATAGDDAEALAELIAYHYQEAVLLARLVGKPVDATARRRAVTWLGRAAGAAESGAAVLEARRHLRSAIELADADELPDLYLRLGRTHLGTNDAIAAFTRAYDLGREQGRSADFLLEVLAQRLLAMTRWFASVARQQADEFQRLVDEAQALLSEATDDRAKARFHISQSFVPFWLGNLGRPVEPDALARAEAEGRTGLAIAERLDDVSLVSAALDGLGAVAAALGDHAEAARVARRRLALGERLSFQERLDAVNVYAWQTSLLGELDESAAAANRALATVLPGQDQAFTLAIANWPPYADALLGRWEEVAAATERCRQLWLDGGRPTAGYALTGLIAGLDVLRSRGDESATESISEVIGAIVEAFEDQHPTRRLADFLGPDAPGLADGVLRHWETYGERLHHVERALAICADRRQPVEPAVLDAVVERARARQARPLLAQALRARGVQREDPDDLREAHALFTEMGAAPYQARVGIELGQRAGDRAMTEAGVAVLESISDVAYLERWALAGD